MRLSPIGSGEPSQIEAVARTGARAEWRILHVVRHVNAGGIAIWLMNVLRHIDRQKYCMDFLVITTQAPRAYGDEIERLGGRIIPCPGYRNPWTFARNFAQIMRECGPYDVVHSHVYNYSGFVLRLAARHGVPVRIAHSHTDPHLKEESRHWLDRLWRRQYLGVTRKWIERYATARLGVSLQAAQALFGTGWVERDGDQVLPLGLDFTPFGVRHDPLDVRRSLGLPDDALVVGNVGNYVWHKNHGFLVQAAAEILRREERAWLLLVGHHLQGSPVEAQVRELGLAERVVIAGPRNDVPRLMSSAMDVFLFPSHYEGLGLVLLEAQATGLPCVLTDSLPREADVVPELMNRLSLSAPAATWATTVLDAAKQRPVARDEAFARVLQSEFNIENSVRALMRVYKRP